MDMGRGIVTRAIVLLGVLFVTASISCAMGADTGSNIKGHLVGTGGTVSTGGQGGGGKGGASGKGGSSNAGQGGSDAGSGGAAGSSGGQSGNGGQSGAGGTSGGGSGGGQSGSGGASGCTDVCQDCVALQSWPGILNQNATCLNCLETNCTSQFTQAKSVCPDTMSSSCKSQCTGTSDGSCFCQCMLGQSGECGTANVAVYNCMYTNCQALCGS